MEYNEDYIAFVLYFYAKYYKDLDMSYYELLNLLEKKENMLIKLLMIELGRYAQRLHLASKRMDAIEQKFEKLKLNKEGV